MAYPTDVEAVSQDTTKSLGHRKSKDGSLGSESPSRCTKLEDERPESHLRYTKAQSTRAYYQVVALSWTLFLNGWDEGTTGAMLPKMQAVYRVDDTVIAMVFVSACLGFLFGACLNVPLSGTLGFGKVLVLGSVLQVIAYAIKSLAPPFPVFIVAYAISGAGIALQEAQASGFVASLMNDTEVKMGVIHACFGIGAFLAPLLATQFTQLELQWSFFFMISLGSAIVNTVLLTVVFRLQSRDCCLAEIGESIDTTGCPTDEKEHGSLSQSHGSFTHILCNRNVHLMAVFLFVYIGMETTVGGWIVTFMGRERLSAAQAGYAGYVSSGFFGGLALGTVGLLWFNSLVGERYAPLIYAALALGLELVVWLVPSFIGGAVSIFMIGFFLGPIYPITMNHAGRTLPREILAESIGWIAGFGQACSAVFPFMTGVLAGKFGIESLQPLLVSMIVVMMILWVTINVASR
ncbi:hypothetical protein V5O48_008308 [Marasmius crinis-equi]|uniref:Major facilitator superfamily (MFS) profile domain-containing protein n=1 Tax=Marasmius crinis-equi TaxID=585013 RepID=A0ABR3FEF4_9AGAR